MTQKMTSSSPGFNDEESSSSSMKIPYDHPTMEDFDGVDGADLGFDNALLADDPLDEGVTNASYVFPIYLTHRLSLI